MIYQHETNGLGAYVEAGCFSNKAWTRRLICRDLEAGENVLVRFGNEEHQDKMIEDAKLFLGLQSAPITFYIGR